MLPVDTVILVGRHGRGVYAHSAIKRNQIIERAPVIVMPRSQVSFSRKHVLSFYVWEWTPTTYALALGHGSLYNHDDDPAVEVTPDYPNAELVYTATRRIAVGEEITISYAGDQGGPLHMLHGAAAREARGGPRKR